MATVALARNAMATRFEVVLHGDDPVRLRAAAEEALDEIQQLEAQLNLYSPSSELTQINARAAREPVRVEPRLFRLLEHARQLWRETEGAFDITIAPLMRAWGFVRDTGRLPDSARLAEARACTGMNLVELDDRAYTIRFQRPGVVLDLGAIGKGYALERAEQLIRDAGVTRGILHGGTSTVCAIGRDEQERPWRVAIARPDQELAARGLARASAEVSASQVLAVVDLEDASLSVSAVWGKAFQAEGRVYGHVLDPRTGEPADRAVLAALALPSATETDALSTALLTLGPAGLDQIVRLRPAARALVVAPGTPPGTFQVSASGIEASSV
jgi:thiamine biosynthesis lipoprotein